MAKVDKQEKERVKGILQEWLEEGTRVYGLVVNVAPSGMSRTIRLFYVTHGDIQEIPPSWVAALIGERFDEKRWGVRVSGCGMDMVFHTVESLGHALWGSGQALRYASL